MFGFGKEKNPILKTVISDPKKPGATGEVVDTLSPAKPPEWQPAGAREAVSGVQGSASGAIVEKRINERTLPTTAHAVLEGEGIGTPTEVAHLTESGNEIRDIFKSRRNQGPLDEKV